MICFGSYRCVSFRSVKTFNDLFKVDFIDVIWPIGGGYPFKTQDTLIYFRASTCTDARRHRMLIS